MKYLAIVLLLVSSASARAFDSYEGGLGIIVIDIAPYGTGIPQIIVPTQDYINSIVNVGPFEYGNPLNQLQIEVGADVSNNQITRISTQGFGGDMGVYVVYGIYNSPSSGPYKNCGFWKQQNPNVMHIVANNQEQCVVSGTGAGVVGGINRSRKHVLIDIEGDLQILVPAPFDLKADQVRLAETMVDAAEYTGFECNTTSNATKHQRAALMAAISGALDRKRTPTKAQRQAVWESYHYGYNRSYTHNYRVGWYWMSERIENGEVPANDELIADAVGDMLRAGNILAGAVWYNKIGAGSCPQMGGKPNYTGPLTPGTDALPPQCANDPSCVNADDPWS